MEPRFEHRKEQLLAACQVPPTLFRGVISRLETFAQPFVASLPSPESRRHTRTYLAGLLSDLERKNAEAIAYRYDLDRQAIQRFLGEVAWDHDPPDRRVEPPGRRRHRPPRRRARLRPLGLPQEGDRLGRRAAAVVRPARQGRELPGRRLPGLRQRLPSTPWSTSGSTCPGSGPRTEAPQEVSVSPRTSATARGTSWPWRCSSAAARRCRTAGSPATTRWAAPRGSAGSWPRGTSDTCWPCRRTRASATWRPSRRRTGGTAVGPRFRSAACGPGARRCPATAWTRLTVRDGEKGPAGGRDRGPARGVEGRPPGRRFRGDAGGRCGTRRAAC